MNDYIRQQATDMARLVHDRLEPGQTVCVIIMTPFASVKRVTMASTDSPEQVQAAIKKLAKCLSQEQADKN